MYERHKQILIKQFNSSKRKKVASTASLKLQPVNQQKCVNSGALTLFRKFSQTENYKGQQLKKILLFKMTYKKENNYSSHLFIKYLLKRWKIP